MLEKTDDHGAEKRTETEAFARLLEGEFDAVVGSGRRRDAVCEGTYIKIKKPSV